MEESSGRRSRSAGVALYSRAIPPGGVWEAGSQGHWAIYSWEAHKYSNSDAEALNVYGVMSVQETPLSAEASHAW